MTTSSPHPDIDATAPTPTGVEALVCRDIAMRQAMGIRKYGTSLQDNPAPLVARLQHLYEELLDGANYAKWAMLQLQQPAPLAPPGVRLSLTVTARSRIAAAKALTDLVVALRYDELLPGQFCKHEFNGTVVQGELDQPDFSGDHHV